MNRNSISIGLIMGLRALYSMNWYNVSPMIFRILKEYNAPLSYSGLILTAFLLGTGIMQIPSGIVASKIGSKNTSMLGMFVLSVASSLSFLSYNIFLFLISRFMIGVGAAFFFSSGIGLLKEIDETNIGKNIGLFNTVFSIGGGFGIILFTIALNIYGRPLILLSYGGIATLLLTIVSFFYIDGKKSIIDEKNFIKNVRGRIFSKPLFMVSMSLAGYWGLNFTIEEFLKSYSQFANFSSTIAGTLGSISLFSGILGYPLFIRMSRIGDFRSLVYSLIVVIITTAFMFTASLYYLIIVPFVTGSMSIVIFSVEYNYVVKIEKDQKFVPLSISIMNSLQIMIGSLITFIFGYSYAFNPYISWIILAIIAFLFFPMGIGTLRKGDVHIS
ncbi:MFS transporter [Caldiplasma sukawensis]